jgi:hypothetical protein
MTGQTVALRNQCVVCLKKPRNSMEKAAALSQATTLSYECLFIVVRD